MRQKGKDSSLRKQREELRKAGDAKGSTPSSETASPRALAEARAYEQQCAGKGEALNADRAGFEMQSLCGLAGIWGELPSPQDSLCVSPGSVMIRVPHATRGTQ